MANPINIKLPVGRVVDGSLYQAQTTDAEGRPLVFKSGPQAGQPRNNYFFGVAIPKTPADNGHWANTPWGQQIWQLGHQAFPGVAASPAFAWKIEDGDSRIPNKRGRIPAEREGWAGCWIVRLSGGYAPRIYRQENGGFVQELTPDYVKPGYWVETAITVDGNGSAQQPGMYLNHSMVCYRAPGDVIVFGPDVNAVGFGQEALPAGVTMAPPPSNIPLPGAPAAFGLPPGQPPLQMQPPAAPAPNGIPTPPLGQAGSVQPPQGYAQGVPAAAPIPVVPNPQFVQVPPPGGSPAAPTAAGIPAIAGVAPPVTYPSNPPAAAKQMTAQAQGTYEAYIQAGWDDVKLIQAGLMLA